MNKNRVIGLTLAIILIVFLGSSCQSNEQENIESSTGQTTTSSNELTVSIFSHSDSHMQAAAELYENKTGIKVNIQNNYYEPNLDSLDRFWDTSIYTEQTLSALLAGSGADIYSVEWLDYAQLGKNGLLVDLSEWLNDNEKYSDDSVFRDILLSGKSDDGIYAIPIYFVFRKICASSNNEPQLDNRRMTWQAFFEQIRETDYSQERAYYDQDINIFMERFSDRASEFIDETRNTQSLDSPEMITLLEECKGWSDERLCLDYTDPNSMDSTFSYFGNPIGSAEIAEALCTLPEEYMSSSYYSNMVCPMPYDGKPILSDGIEKYPEKVEDLSYYAINAGSPNAELAKDFLQFLLSEEAQEAMLATGSSGGFQIPINRAAFRNLLEKDLEKIQNSNRNLKLDVPSLIGEAEKTINEIAFIIPEKPYYRTIIRETASQFFLGKTTAKEAAKQMANKMDLYLKEQK